MEATLTIIETGRLNDLERRIEAARMSFVDAGEALAEIRDERFYRLTHGTFEDYCQERWGLSRVHAHRLIEAASAVERIRLLPIGNILPATESQARELTRLEDPDQQIAAWEKVVERTDGDPKKITAKVVREEVQKLLPEKDDDAPFLIYEERAEVSAWLEARRKKWPAELQETFCNCVRGILEELDSAS